jgi:acetyltransferase-like isoleucine patch superfamily enzyme
MTRLEHDWFPAPLPAGVEIGPRSWVHSAHAFQHYASRRDPGVRIGHDSGVYVGTYFELGPEGQVEIGDYCSVVGAIIATNGRVKIGSHSFVAHEVVIADTAAATPPDARERVAWPAGASIEIGDTAWIGTRALLLDGARIGPGAIVGAGAVVDFEVPAGATVAGNPARVVATARP